MLGYALIPYYKVVSLSTIHSNGHSPLYPRTTSNSAKHEGVYWKKKASLTSTKQSVKMQ